MQYLEIIKAAKETLNIDKSPDSKRERAIFGGEAARTGCKNGDHANVGFRRRYVLSSNHFGHL